MTDRCPHCHSPNPEGLAFCDHCGTALTALAGVPYQIFRYDAEHARNHRAYASVGTYVLRALINIALPIALLIIFWARFYAQGIGVIVMLLVGLAAFTGRDLWTRRHLLRARRSAVVWDRAQDLLAYVTFPDEASARDDTRIVRAMQTPDGGDADVVHLTDRRVKLQSYRQTVYTYLAEPGRAATLEIPHAFPGFEEVER